MKTYNINPDGTPYEEPEGAEKILKNFREAFSDKSVNEILLLNKKLQQQLKEAREVIEFYDDLDRGKAGLRRNQAQLWLKKYGGEE